jgi:hypothetical protein
LNCISFNPFSPFVHPAFQRSVYPSFLSIKWKSIPLVCPVFNWQYLLSELLFSLLLFSGIQISPLIQSTSVFFSGKTSLAIRSTFQSIR